MTLEDFEAIVRSTQLEDSRRLTRMARKIFKQGTYEIYQDTRKLRDEMGVPFMRKRYWKIKFMKMPRVEDLETFQAFVANGEFRNKLRIYRAADKHLGRYVLANYEYAMAITL